MLKKILLAFGLVLAVSACTNIPVHNHRSNPFVSARDSNDRLMTSPDHTYVSTNWSGYVLLGGGYSNASLTWQVPSVTWGTNSGSTTEYASEWVGIGGVNDNTIVQLGTDNAVSSGGQTSYFPWYEFYPAGAVG